MATNAQKKKRLRDLVGSGTAHGVNIALQELDGNERGLDKLLDNGDELRAAVIQIITSKARELSVSDRFKDEEVGSKYGYLSGYKKPVGIEAQIDILRSYWPQLNPEGAIRYMREVYPTLRLPGWVEGPFAQIRPGFFSENYGEELEEALKALAESVGGRFVNYRAGQMDRFRRHAHAVAAYDRIVEQQNDSDILIVLGQFGIRHRGRSVRRVHELMRDTIGEFGEGAKNGATMLLTHPNRLAQLNDLWLDFPGDEFDDPGSRVRFDRAPYFVLNDGRVRFGTNWFAPAYDHYGSATGFLSQ
jgi:hypothetical protein